MHQNASQEEIVKRVNEKKKHFEVLIQNAPNDYLKNIHQKNINKLEEIKMTLTKELKKLLKKILGYHIVLIQFIKMSGKVG